MVNKLNKWKIPGQSCYINRGMAIMWGFTLFSLRVFGQHVPKNPAVVWEDLPFIRTGVKLWSHTSKSPLNKTVQDFLNYTSEGKNGYEMANYEGESGMLVHCWFAFLSNDSTGRMKLFDSKKSTSGIDKSFKNYFNSRKYPEYLWESKDGIWWAFPCLPFHENFKAYSDIKPQWYQFTLHLFRSHYYSEAISKADLAGIYKKMQNPVGSFPGKVPGNRHKTVDVIVGANKTVTFFNDVTPGVIRQIHLTLPQGDSTAMDSIYISVSTDSEVTACLPIAFFFGGYAKVNMNNARGMPAGFDGKSLYNYFPMPFWKSFKMELINKQQRPIHVSCQFNWSDSNPYPEQSTGTFRVKYNPPTAVKAGQPDFVNLSVKGSGIMVGTVSQLTGAIEANFSIYVDGSKTPAVESTGGEDYFNHSYGIHPGFTRPFSGGLAKDIGYRFHIIDYIPFVNSLLFTQDHAIYYVHDRDGIFNSAIYYYYNPKQYLERTDSIDIGDLQSETSHSYTIRGTKAQFQNDRAGYEGDFDTLFSDAGRWTNGSTAFTIHINPKNDGVRIRKRINQTSYHQRVKVFVDNKFAGNWFEQGANYYLNKRLYYNDSLPDWQKGNITAKFRDTEFEIPGSFTKGKSQLKIRTETVGSLSVDPAKSGLTNEYYYWIYSYLPVQ
ncbi:DUF2961 domain-containing protein [Ginsengibacter hankyongi]|uniref:DUF2961 domain-containing protein n=1 Tax=Ginsengibacter hankyongi TaxID=2607284 RepID=A0A5J5IBU5_9BACT|nr:DUF2961 domain-containing protein [Ginsengibacter hankyongi]KAA9034355.1 DUF2961 domain-containing protein [Ginsengibacter hankyongi]